MSDRPLIPEMTCAQIQLVCESMVAQDWAQAQDDTYTPTLQQMCANLMLTLELVKMLAGKLDMLHDMLSRISAQQR